MAKKAAAKEPVTASRLKLSALLDTRAVYCGDNLEQLAKVIVALTVQEILDEHLAKKLA